MLIYPSLEIICYSGVKGSRFIGHDVDIIMLHATIFEEILRCAASAYRQDDKDKFWVCPTFCTNFYLAKLGQLLSF